MSKTKYSKFLNALNTTLMELQKDRFYSLLSVIVLALVLIFGPMALDSLSQFSGVTFWVLLLLGYVMVFKIYKMGADQPQPPDNRIAEWIKLFESSEASSFVSKVFWLIAVLMFIWGLVWRSPELISAIAPNGFY